MGITSCWRSLALTRSFDTHMHALCTHHTKEENNLVWNNKSARETGYVSLIGERNAPGEMRVTFVHPASKKVPPTLYAC